KLSFPNHTLESTMKSEPTSSISTSESQTFAESGVTDNKVGTGFGAKTLKLYGSELPPPAPALKTVTSKSPASSKSAEGMVACRCVESMNVVDRSLPSQRTTEPSMSPSSKKY